MKRAFIMCILAVTAGCGQARAPGNEDACARDGDCAAGLMCCHISGDAPSGAPARGADRGFCVKQSVCANVVAPPQAAPLEE